MSYLITVTDYTSGDYTFKYNTQRKTPIIRDEELKYLQIMWVIWRNQFLHHKKHTYEKEARTVINLLCDSNGLKYPEVVFKDGQYEHQRKGYITKGIYIPDLKRIEIFYHQADNFHCMFKTVVHEWLHHFDNIHGINNVSKCEKKIHKQIFYDQLRDLIKKIECCNLIEDKVGFMGVLVH